MLHWLTPSRFEAIRRFVLPYSSILMSISLIVGLYFSLLASPLDYQQGQTVRIMYVHVPAAWMALGVYIAMALSGLSLLVWKNPLSEMAGISLAYLGTFFTVICLITGMLWGKPMWGAWWVWDARLTSVLVLLFFYVGYIALYKAFDEESQGARMAAILSLIGIINIPIIKFSVEWWNTLHQPASIMRKGGVSIHTDMLTPLLLMFAFYIFYTICVSFFHIHTQILQRKIARIRLKNIG
jgi:heme exporter protein C